MSNLYPNYLLDELHHGASRNAMAPPPPPVSTLDQPMHGTQNSHMSFSGGGLHSSSDMYANMNPWNLPRASHTGFGPGEPSRSSAQPMLPAPTSNPPSNPQISLGRTTVVSQETWMKHRPVLQKLWIEEKKPLLEIMALMSENHHFKASQDQYKKQFRKWKWSKYIPAKDGSWMLWKADQRKREEGKNTEFEYRGQTLTETSIRPRLERKKVESATQDLSPDARTPSDIDYRTPRSHVLSPPGDLPAFERRSQPAWTPPPGLNRQPQMRLMWNGYAKADFHAQYEEALVHMRSGRKDEAEATFKSALEGLCYLLSSSHPETVTIAYRLASFYFEHTRMKDADAVLDWLTQEHLGAFGFSHERTFDHLENVIEMCRNWGRPEDAANLVKQILYELEKKSIEPDSARVTTTASGSSTHTVRVDNPIASHDREHTSDFSLPPEGPIEPSVLEAQLGRTASETHRDEGAETVLLRLTRHCEEFPDELRLQSLLCYTVLLNYYDSIGDTTKKSAVLDRAEQAIGVILHSDEKKTKDSLLACVKLAKHLVRAGRYAAANEIFTEIESEAQETFGSDHLTTIWFLELIGIFLEQEGRWEDAAPRFEHALAASLSRYGVRHERVKRLEATLENRYHKPFLPSEGHAYACDDEPLIRAVRALRRLG